MLKRIMYTSDPYEPSGTIGIYETEEQRRSIIDTYRGEMLAGVDGGLGWDYFRDQLFEEEIQLGVYYPVN